MAFKIVQKHGTYFKQEDIDAIQAYVDALSPEAGIDNMTKLVKHLVGQAKQIIPVIAENENLQEKIIQLTNENQSLSTQCASLIQNQVANAEMIRLYIQSECREELNAPEMEITLQDSHSIISEHLKGLQNG